MKRLFCFLKNNNGSILIYVLIILIVVSLLGTAVLTIASFSLNETYVKRSETQASYTARSAIETTIDYLSKNMVTQTLIPATAEDPAIISNLNTAPDDMGIYKVKIERIDVNTAKITCTAKYNNQTATVCSVITIEYGPDNYVNLEKYATYLKDAPSNTVSDPVTITSEDLNYSNFVKAPLVFKGNINNTISNLTTADFNKITATKTDPGWNNIANATLDLTEGGVYTFDGDINLGRDVNIIIGDNDVFLFVNGSFCTNKFVDIKKLTVNSIGSFFIILCGDAGVTRAFDVNQGSKGLNVSTAENLRANVMVYGPDVSFLCKNKYYFQGGLIVKKYTGQGSSNFKKFKTPYLKNGVSPWKLLFDYLIINDIHIIPPATGAINDVLWENTYTPISLS